MAKRMPTLEGSGAVNGEELLDVLTELERLRAENAELRRRVRAWARSARSWRQRAKQDREVALELCRRCREGSWWIPVEEELPSGPETVMVVVEGVWSDWNGIRREYELWTGRYVHGAWEVKGWGPDPGVIAWRPAPPLPERSGAVR